MSRFISKKYESLVPYTPGEQPKVVGKLIKLNTNENPYAPSPAVVQAVAKAEEVADLKLYPQPDPTALIEAIADFNGLKADQVMVGNGSDEVLAFIFMAFQNEEAKIVYPEISYSFYPVYCDTFQANGVPVPLDENFRVVPSDYFNAGGTIVITNPNAPTGIALTLEEIRSILDNNRDNVVVIDEAYVDFGAESAVSLIDEYDNLLVVQTFSKSRSLAGARVGFAMGASELIADLNKIKFSFNPYNLNRLSIIAATEAMNDVDYLFETTSMIMSTRERFVTEMKALGFKVLPSMSNFVFVSSDKISGEEYFTALRKYNIIVRYFKTAKISNFVRITIGTDEDMMALIEATREILSGR
ncbi:MAG: histidinol-phosphate transaminase [Eubacterium sp.]|nr:histidinol-phosphate transaminase [Candidatus Colimonas fimequi]